MSILRYKDIKVGDRFKERHHCLIPGRIWTVEKKRIKKNKREITMWASCNPGVVKIEYNMREINELFCPIQDKKDSITKNIKNKKTMFCDDCGKWYIPDSSNPRECPYCRGTKTLTEKEWFSLEDCGCCGMSHPPSYVGDCRNNAQRFAG